ncbi:hypothetical protein WJX73_007564 [Symbiochloris irregularis]|uniref:Uncharacterized protein n=1 Tax=Symbiochloris irregularis TaxID=706552 RepID=A0AAW1P4W2_9CHLO
MALAWGEVEGLGDWLLVEDESTAQVEQALKAVKLTADGYNLPMKARAVSVLLDCIAGTAEVKETLTFHCERDCSADFTFPVPGKAAITRFEAVIGTRTIATETKPKAEANQEFREATAQGHTAVKLQEASSARLLQVSLGNLAAGTPCQLTIEYLQVLDSISNVLEFTHQATWVPPYCSSHWDAGQEVQPAYTAKATYSLSYIVAVHHAPEEEPSSIKSCTHAIRATATSPSALSLSSAEEVSDAGKDFQLAISMSGPRQSRLQMQTRTLNGESKSHILASFTPAAAPAPPSKSEPRPVIGPLQEAILVIDCSGSMGGEPIEQARQAATFFVRDLPFNSGVFFNIVVFGSSHMSMWPSAQQYNEGTEGEALRWIERHVHATLGGTDIQGTLRSIYDTPLATGRERQIVFLTDGGISSGQVDVILAMVERGCDMLTDAARTQVWSLGIGFGVHRPLLDGMASRSMGASVYITGQAGSSDIARKVAWLSKAAFSEGVLRKPRLVTHACLLSIVPSHLPSVLLPGTPFVVLAEVKKAEEDASLELVCEDANGKELRMDLPLPAKATSTGSSFSTLHAMWSITELLASTNVHRFHHNGKASDERAAVKEVVVKLACAYGLVTPYTSRVGVQLKRDPLDPSQVQHSEIPLQMPAGRVMSTPATTPSGLSQSVGSWYRPGRTLQTARRKQCSTVRALLFASGSAAPPTTPLLATADLYDLRAVAAQMGGEISVRGSNGASTQEGVLPEFGKYSSALPSSSPGVALTQGGNFLSGSGGLFGAATAGSYPPAKGPPLFGATAGAQGQPGSSFTIDSSCGSIVNRGSAIPSPASSQQAQAVPADPMSWEPTPSKEGGSNISAPGRNPVEVFGRLRETEGYWKPSEQLMVLLSSRRASGTVSSLEGLLPAASADSISSANPLAQTTALVLAWLHKYSQGQRALWERMWDKALAWLQVAPGAGSPGGSESDAALQLVMGLRKFV